MQFQSFLVLFPSNGSIQEAVIIDFPLYLQFFLQRERQLKLVDLIVGYFINNLSYYGVKLM